MFYLNQINNIKLLNAGKFWIDFEFQTSIWPISVFAEQPVLAQLAQLSMADKQKQST